MTMFSYFDETEELEGFLALPQGPGPHPCVLIAHNWAGQSEADNGVARWLAALGYAGFAIDVYGKGTRGDPMGDNGHLMNSWLADRAGLQARLLAAVDAAAANPAIDSARVAIIGYCFGGLCALDVARSGDARVKAAVSFHGVYAPTGLADQPAITAKVLVLHGWDDPMTPPAATVALGHELNAAGADWQIHAYGHTMHAFTAPQANNPAGGIQYSADADRRSWAAMIGLLAETL